MKVRILPSQPHCFAFGGFDIQMMDAMRAVRQEGVDIDCLDIWSTDAGFDILHLWGVEESHLNVLKWARRARKKVVVTGLLSYISPYTIFRNLVSRFIGPNRRLRSELREVDAMVVVNDAQAKAARWFFGIAPEKIKIVPNIINAAFLSPSPEVQPEQRLMATPYLLCTGNVCRRKNQLELVEAANDAAIPLLLIGGVLTGEEKYAEQVRSIVQRSDGVQWIPHLPPGDPQLVAAYRDCVGFVLLSHSETQPISVLEAIASKKPILLSKRNWAMQPEFSGACLVDPSSREKIAKALREFVNHSVQYHGTSDVVDRCTDLNIGRSYVKLYCELGAQTSEITRALANRRIDRLSQYRIASAVIGFRARLKYGISLIPPLAYLLMKGARRGYSKRDLFVSTKTAIVIEGYPRSGNTFATCAFQFAQGGAQRVSIAHHLHSLANIIAGVRLGLPVLVVIRAPKDAIVSYKIRHPSRSFSSMLHEYILFHQGVEKYLGRIVLASFEDVIGEFGEITRRINRRFDSNFNCFDGDRESIDAVFRMIDHANLNTGGGNVMQVARPAKEREPLKRIVERELMESNSLQGLILEANEVYQRLSLKIEDL